MIMVKPISRTSYYVSKICAYACLTLFSLVVAVLASVYYVDIQFGHVDWVNVLKGTLLYYPNLLLIVVSTICASAFSTFCHSWRCVAFNQPYSVYRTFIL